MVPCLPRLARALGGAVALARRAGAYVTYALRAVRRPRQRRRALLIGVNYAQSKLWDPLTGQQDACRFRDFLIEDRGWAAEEIVLMLDEKTGCEPGRLCPTQSNIRREIHHLVHGARRGEHFVFFYAGHSAQLPNKRGRMSEADGMDEVIIPSDCDAQMNLAIVDNELRKILVDQLPAGCTLTAVFDSCHSGTMLDLDHENCNAVYVPWVNKGLRQSDTRRNVIARKDDADHTPEPLAPTNRNPLSARRAQSAPNTSCTQSFSAFALDAALETELEPKHADGTEPLLPAPVQARGARPPVRARPRPLLPRLTLPARPGAWEKLASAVAGAFFTDARSPVLYSSPETALECDGFCRDRPCAVGKGKGKAGADVICLSACADEQQTYEDNDGTTMTAELISILLDNPECTYETLLLKLSYRLYASTRKVHDYSRGAKRMRRIKRRQQQQQQQLAATASMVVTNENQPPAPAPPVKAQVEEDDGLDMDNFQYPQLSSMHPLDMSKQFVL